MSLLDNQLIVMMHFMAQSRRYYVLDDTMVDYLQYPTNPNKSSQAYRLLLNRKLIEGYRQYCKGKWHTFPDDGYYYQYLMYHIQQAEDNDLLDFLSADQYWIETQFQIYKKKRYLSVDLQENIRCLAQKQHMVYYITILLLKGVLPQ